MSTPEWTRGTWGDVMDGDTVLGADGHAWEAERYGQRITLRREGRKPVTASPEPTRPARYRRGSWGRELAGAIEVFEFAGFVVEPVVPAVLDVRWLGGGGRRR